MPDRRWRSCRPPIWRSGGPTGARQISACRSSPSSIVRTAWPAGSRSDCHAKRDRPSPCSSPGCGRRGSSSPRCCGARRTSCSASSGPAPDVSSPLPPGTSRIEQHRARRAAAPCARAGVVASEDRAVLRATRAEAAVERVVVSAYTIPTDAPESDGTLEWGATTIVTVEPAAAGMRGFGYTYADVATARLISDRLAGIVLGQDAMATPGLWAAMVRSIRNLGRPGVASMAVAAVDAALWDLKARLLGLPLLALLGEARAAVPVYGSGGFTSYSPAQLARQLSGWRQAGIPRVKMKIGRDPAADRERVRIAREAIGPDAELFVDANGAYSRKRALAQAEALAAYGVSWFEEPVSSDDLEGLRLLRDSGPAGMDIAAGEYGYDAWYFRRMIEAGAVEVAQASVCLFRPTLRRRSTHTPAVRHRELSMWSISSITRESKRWLLRGRSK